MIPSQPVRVTCPQCRQPFTAQIQSIIDVGMQPALKEQLLGGQLNLVRCPFCGSNGMLATPLLYHDPAHELALVHIPLEANLKREDQEKLIGALTNALMDSLPPERRKGYLLQPRTVLTFDSLIETILQADGVTPEMLQTQRQQLQLIQDLLDRLSDDERLKALVDERREELNYEFFLLLSAALDSARQDGDQAGAGQLSRLREKLLTLTGGPSQQQIKEIEPLPASATPQQLIETFQAAPTEELYALVAAYRHRLDYSFFQTLTGQIEAAKAGKDSTKAEQLTDLRRKLLEAADEVDRQSRAALERGAKLLEAILQSDNPQQTIRERLNEIDEATLVVFQANIAEARRQGQTQIAELLEGIYAYLLSQLEEQLPVEIRLVNRLLRAPTREARQKILEQEPGVAWPALLDLLSQIETDVRQQGETALADRIQEVRAQLQVHIEVAR